MEEETVAQEIEEEGENRFEGPDSRLPCARGGPIFVLDLVGPFSSVPDFKASVLHDLQCLQSDLLSAPSSDLDLSYEPLLFCLPFLLTTCSDKIYWKWRFV